MSESRKRSEVGRGGRVTAYSRAQARADLAAVYARVPALICKGRCADACTRIDASEIERQILRDRGIELPPSVRHPQHLALIAQGEVGRCPALGPLNTCTVYEDRPLVCRSFGTWRTSACEHGCVASRMIEVAEFGELVSEIESISQRWITAGRP